MLTAILCMPELKLSEPPTGCQNRVHLDECIYVYMYVYIYKPRSSQDPVRQVTGSWGLEKHVTRAGGQEIWEPDKSRNQGPTRGSYKSITLSLSGCAFLAPARDDQHVATFREAKMLNCVRRLRDLGLYLRTRAYGKPRCSTNQR